MVGPATETIGWLVSTESMDWPMLVTLQYPINAKFTGDCYLVDDVMSYGERLDTVMYEFSTVCVPSRVYFA